METGPRYKVSFERLEKPGLESMNHGPSCSKLTTSLVNVSLKFQTLIFFVEKM